VLFNTAAAAQANVPPPTNCTTVGAETTCDPITTSTSQPAGLETARHTPNMIAAFTNQSVKCPNGLLNCTTFSNPVLKNDLFWQNRTFSITVGGQNLNIAGLQNAVSLNPTLNQTGQSTGYCDPKAAYWDIGAYGDASPAKPQPNLTMSPQFSILTDAKDYPNAHNSPLDPKVVSQYCNGSRMPPEAGGIGIAVPPGIADTVLPNPLFSLLPSAVPDEGNNWINMSYGPLSLFNEAGSNINVLLGNYSITSASPALGAATPASAPNHDIYGTPRPQVRPLHGGYDIGAVEYVSSSVFGATPTDPLALGAPSSGLFGLGAIRGLAGLGAIRGLALDLAPRGARK
jgi:hypothetical protein